MELKLMKVETQNISHEDSSRTVIILPKNNNLFTPGLLEYENELVISESKIGIRIGHELYSGELTTYEIDKITKQASDKTILWESERIPLLTIIKYRIKNKLRIKK